MIPFRISLPVLVGIALGLVKRQRIERELGRSVAVIARYHVERDQSSAFRERELIALTRILARLTWVLLAVAAVTLLVTVLVLTEAV